MSQRFSFKDCKTFGPRVRDLKTGRWMGVDLVKEMASVVPVALWITPREDTEDQAGAVQAVEAGRDHGRERLHALYYAAHANQRTATPEYANTLKEKWIERVLDAAGESLRTAALAATQPSTGDEQGEPDGSTPGQWRVEKRERHEELVMCWVAAPDCNGFAYDAEILGDDEYRDGEEAKAEGMSRRLADCELIVKAVAFYRSYIKATQPSAAPGDGQVARAALQAAYIALAEVPCACSARRREEGEHLSGCHLFDLCAAIDGLAAPGAAIAAREQEPDATPADFGAWLLGSYKGHTINASTIGRAIAEYNDECDASPAAAPTSQPNAAAQEQEAGWRWVPVEPTPEMCDAGFEGRMQYLRNLQPGYVNEPLDEESAAYRAMLAAAPAPTGMGSVGLPSGRGIVASFSRNEPEGDAPLKK